MYSKYAAQLQNVKLFEGMKIEEILKVLKCLNAYGKQYTRGSYIYIDGDYFEDIGIILEGKVLVNREYQNGNVLNINTLDKNDTFGEDIICLSNSYAPYSLILKFFINSSCAAGTGAFIEEQIKKIGINLEDFGDIALAGDNPCDLGDRCTVFIEGNIGKAISQNESIKNISAGLAYSIVKNYLTRVVGNRKIGEKILLQGGIAHNQAVVNAFRATLNKKIIVPKFFSVTGALGAAVLLKKNIN